MKINGNKGSYSEATFLGGTCDADSTWRKELISMLNENVAFFDPQLESGEWTIKKKIEEKKCKEVCKKLVFVITSEPRLSYYAFKLGILSELNAARIIFCAHGEFPENQINGIETITREVAKKGGTICNSLEEIAMLLNAAY